MNFSIRKLLKGDRIIWIVLFFLTLISMLVVYSATGRLAYRNVGGNTAHYVIRQAIFILMGFGIMIILVNVVPVKLYASIANLLLIIVIIFMVLAVFQNIFSVEKVTSRSLDIGPFSFQPGEMAKIVIVIFSAKILSERQESREELKNAFFKIIIASFIICGIIMIGNASTAIMIFGCIWVLMYIGRVPLKFLGLTVLFGVLLIGSVYLTADYFPAGFGRVHTVKERIDNFVHGDDDSKNGTTQLEYAKLAIYEGGFTGNGPGSSEVSNYMEDNYNDFIFSIIVEEYGLIGGFFLLFLYLVLFYRGVVIVRRSNRTFPAFMATGLILILVFQAMIHMAVNVGLGPVTGQPLPWVSMGGTSILFTSVSLGILLSVSYQNQQNDEKEKGKVVETKKKIEG